MNSSSISFVRLRRLYWSGFWLRIIGIACIVVALILGPGAVLLAGAWFGVLAGIFVLLGVPPYNVLFLAGIFLLLVGHYLASNNKVYR